MIDIDLSSIPPVVSFKISPKNPIEYAGDILKGFYALTNASFNLCFTSNGFKHKLYFNLKAGEQALAFKTRMFPLWLCPYTSLFIEDLEGQIEIIYMNIPLEFRRKYINTKFKIIDDFYISGGNIYNTPGVFLTS